MATFAYTARDKSGALSQGKIFASDRAAAVADLSGKGLSPILVKEDDKATAKKGFSLSFLSGKVKLQDKVVFSRQFATMINAGVPITKSLAILKEQSESKKLRQVIGDVSKRVEGGSTLASALAEHKEVFSPIFINMVAAGETGGILDQTLDRLAGQQEKDAEIISKVRGAMIYPGVITTATVGAYIFLMVVVVPKLAAIFEDLNAELPAYTKFMLAVSSILVKYGLFVAIGAGLLGYGIWRWVHTPKGKRLLDQALLHLPIFGPILRKVNVARFARTFGSLMASGISVLDAIESTSLALGNTAYKEELTKIAQQVKNGQPISESMKGSKNFPPIVAQMIAVGEETGQMDEILLKLAVFFEKEVDTVIEGLTSIIEPLLMIVLGAMVGSIILAVFTPIANLSNTVG